MLGPPANPLLRRGFDAYQKALREGGDPELTGWPECERALARTLSQPENGQPSALAKLYTEILGTPVEVSGCSVNAGIFRGQNVFVLGLSPAQVHLAEPKQEWPPPKEANQAVGAMLGLLLKREWVFVITTCRNSAA